LPNCRSKDGLQVHHRTYERLGEEVPEDLTVLCLSCHNQWHRGIIPGQPDPLGVYVALAYETLKAEKPDHVTDWLNLTKTRCARLHIPYGDRQVDQAVDRIRRTIKDPSFMVPVVPPELLPPSAPSVSHREAVEILGRVGLSQVPLPTMTAVRQLTDEEIRARLFRVDQRQAFRLVQQAILDTAQRVAALEAAVEEDQG
jgi:hypothetical protein